LPMLRTENMLGALISYQSFFVNGSTLRAGKETKENAARQSPSREKPQNPRIRSGSHRRRAASSRRANDALDAKFDRKRFHRVHPVPRVDSRARGDTHGVRAHPLRGASPGPTLLEAIRPVPSPSRRCPVAIASRRIASHVRLLLAALLALGHALVLADSHLERLSLAVECSRLVKADGAARADDAVRVPAEGGAGAGVWFGNQTYYT